MPILAINKINVRQVAEDAVSSLVAVRHWGDSVFVNVPLVYPSGSFVTVKLDHVQTGIRVSDNGFAYREAETFGAQRSFARTAGTIAEEESLSVGKRAIYVDVTPEELSRAICDVAAASWQVATQIVDGLSEKTDIELEDYLRERLPRLFGEQVKDTRKIVGASTTEWEVSAIVQLPGHQAIFQAVANHSNSVFRASTAFRDIFALEAPPKLVAVVHNRSQFGPRLMLLSQSQARVIEDTQPDDTYVKAAA